VRARPISLREANALVTSWHRHHKVSQGQKFSIACEVDGEFVGAVIVGRPVARGVDFRTTAEVTRLVTNGTKNACSFLYSAAARAAEAMGYDFIQTYILETEPGSSLRAAGFVMDGVTSGGSWNSSKEYAAKPRREDQPQCPKHRYLRVLRNKGVK